MFKFLKKKKEGKSMTYDEVMQCINSLSEEEREKIKIGLAQDNADSEEKTEEQSLEAKGAEGETDATEEKTEDPSNNAPVPETAKADGEPEKVNGETAVQKAEQESEELKDKTNEVNDALNSRMSAIESKVDMLVELMKVKESAKESNFGAPSKLQADNKDGYADRDKQVMDSYYKGNKSAYMQ